MPAETRCLDARDQAPQPATAIHLRNHVDQEPLDADALADKETDRHRGVKVGAGNVRHDVTVGFRPSIDGSSWGQGRGGGGG